MATVRLPPLPLAPHAASNSPRILAPPTDGALRDVAPRRISAHFACQGRTLLLEPSLPQEIGTRSFSALRLHSRRSLPRVRGLCSRPLVGLRNARWPQKWRVGS